MEEIIEHHGVKGQRWGVRKRISSLGSGKAKRKSSDAASSQKKWKSTYANRSKMSTKELQDAVTRLNLENQLSQSISKIPRTQSQRAVSAISKFAGNVIQQQAASFLSNQLSAYIKKKVNK